MGSRSVWYRTAKQSELIVRHGGTGLISPRVRIPVIPIWKNSLTSVRPLTPKCDVPVQAIADDRDDNYRDEEEDTIGFIREGSLDNYEITDWAANNMNWDEVQEFAVQVHSKTKPNNYQEGWMNGEKEIIGNI